MTTTQGATHGRMLRFIAVLSAVLMLLCVIAVPDNSVAREVSAAETNRTIENNTFWHDTSGTPIYSQGGGVFKFGDTYYWYGVKYNGAVTYYNSPTKKNEDTSFAAVTCYSSKDLVNWKFENNVLTPSSKNFTWAYWFGRLGVCYNKNTKKYVLISQHNDSVMFASCDSPTGDFTVERIQDQITNVVKQGTGDQTIFIDDDGKAYIICSNKGGRGHQYVVPLRESDYLYAEPAIEVAKGSGREGNCMFKYKGKYYFCASDLHGWNSSHTYYMVADKLTGPYSAWKVMSGTDEDFSHVTQTGFFVTVHGSEEETVLYCGDRWSDFAGNGIGYNQWVPLSFNGDEPIFNSMTEWDFYAETGKWNVGQGNNYVLNFGFDADRVSQTKLAGWDNSGTGNGNASGAHIGRFCMQQWADSAFNGTMSQNIKLPNGTYTLKAWVKSSGGQNSSKIYISGYGGEEKNVSVNKAINDWTEIVISDIQITNKSCQVGISSNGNSGNWVKVDDFSLVRTSLPEPVPDGKYIKKLSVNDTENASDWTLKQNPKTGDAVFGDREFTFTNIPAVLSEGEWLQTACDSKKFASDEASFTAGEDVTVYVALDTRVTLPVWLGDWTATDDELAYNCDSAVTAKLYRKDFAADSKVVLGAVNQSTAVNYAVFVTAKSAQPLEVIGDVTDDGAFNVSDIQMQQKAILGGGKVTKPQAGDLDKDGTANAIDLCIMKRMALTK